jgi:hypothetical protein
MPTLLKFAKPQMATDTISRPFSETMGTLRVVRFWKATNSFMVSFWPSKVATLATSAPGTPMAQAMG